MPRGRTLASAKATARYLLRNAYLMYLLARDRRVPWLARGVAAGSVAYVSMPFNLIPDYVPVIGFFDDLGVVWLGLWLARRLVPAHLLAEHRATMDRRFPDRGLTITPRFEVPKGRDPPVSSVMRPGVTRPQSFLASADNFVITTFLWVATFRSLWFINSGYRGAYQATENDVTGLADGLLLLPRARWTDWFTIGHAHFFDPYPEWTWNSTPFARPAYQFLIYLAHFVFGPDWASYLAINYLCVAVFGTTAFIISHAVLRLGMKGSLFAASLAFASPQILQASIWEVGFGSEPLAAVFVATAFLAVIGRRDLLCAVLLSLALLSKETTVWAPFAAFLTVLLRVESDRGPRQRLLSATLVLLPLGMWFALRFAFFGGIGGSYATAGYTHVLEFFQLVVWKFEHLNRLFMSQTPIISNGPLAIAERVLMIGAYGLIWLLLTLWLLHSARSAIDRVMQVNRTPTWPLADNTLHARLWAALGLAFYFAVPVGPARYATSAMIFVWPTLVSEVARRDKLVLRIALATCFMLSLARLSYFMVEMNLPSGEASTRPRFAAIDAMDAALSSVPPDIQQVYVVAASGLVPATPAYIRAFLGMKAELVRIVDVDWSCHDSSDVVDADHWTAKGWITLSAILPDCANFYFFFAPTDAATAFHDGQLQRDSSIIYELPDAQPYDVEQGFLWVLGKRVVVRIHPSGRARFIIEHGAAGGGLTWFDTP